MNFADTLWTVLGAGLILLMLADVFHTLLYPHGSGPAGRAIMRGVWFLTKKLRGRASSVAAPLAMAAVIAAWASLAATGWALLYLPHLPDGFVYGPGVPRHADFAEALYISLVSLSTVGFGEIVAADPLLRLVSGFQAITGFGLLTATVTWILQTYPALNRRRALAHQLNLFREAAGPAGLSALEPGHAAGLLESMAGNVASVSIDLLAFHETYYFREVDQRGSLPATVAYAQELASEASQSQNQELRFAGRMLHSALEGLADVLRGRFGHSGTTSSDVFDSYELHHRDRRAGEPDT
ncbi:voltage-gated potassium channel Kch [Pseudarthrobacter siccitolerans]|uniref:Voltage-gated potassium channel Kch n=1 Tax=Pseudarthrobacter siccitolerans TaxID=861266 RepID=A0ABU0PQ40_9MICC|nr:potassium channel family protein [Pseudarthrobacter siccitolerans]MDQ0676051.1 voltage-gated potassium channel Kch [Pseudarthrobacter siccitolerans]